MVGKVLSELTYSGSSVLKFGHAKQKLGIVNVIHDYIYIYIYIIIPTIFLRGVLWKM